MVNARHRQTSEYLFLAAHNTFTYCSLYRMQLKWLYGLCIAYCKLDFVRISHLAVESLHCEIKLFGLFVYQNCRATCLAI